MITAMGVQPNVPSASPARVWVIVGASRGIGEQYVDQVGLVCTAHPTTMSHFDMANMGEHLFGA